MVAGVGRGGVGVGEIGGGVGGRGGSRLSLISTSLPLLSLCAVGRERERETTL